MPRRKLNNYLRTYRKRAGFSQRELAFLLGCKNAAKVTRYERFARQPTLRTSLFCEAIFGAPVRELFAGVYSEVEREAARRAAVLSRRLQKHKPDRLTARKLELLRMIAITADIIAENE
jgi:transcriptional regulator with XRE-family HTH domain